jgi:hypothetical protein
MEFLTKSAPFAWIKERVVFAKKISESASNGLTYRTDYDKITFVA